MVQQQVNGELLPHCGYDDAEDTRLRKAIFLGMMTRRMLYIHLKYEEADDRDFEGRVQDFFFDIFFSAARSLEVFPRAEEEKFFSCT
jgi:hypothetical protein